MSALPDPTSTESRGRFPVARSRSTGWEYQYEFSTSDFNFNVAHSKSFKERIDRPRSKPDFEESGQRRLAQGYLMLAASGDENRTGDTSELSRVILSLQNAAAVARRQ